MKSKVKASERSRILSTKDYSVFEFPDTNISKKHLELVTASFSEKDLSADFPIVVDDDLKILDGRYKFLACYELRLPIHYKISEVTTLQDAIRIKEIFKKRPLTEIIQFFIDKIQYANLIVMKKETELSYADILRAIPSALRFHAREQGRTFNMTGDFSVVIDRYKIASGRLGEWDYSRTKARLSKAKYIVDEFAWDFKNAIKLLIYHDDVIDFEKEAGVLRRVRAKVSTELTKAANPNGQQLFGMYKILKYVE